jgi:signal transduction histidine kinase
MRNGTFDSSLLSVFRLFVGIRLIFVAISWLALRLIVVPFHPFYPIISYISFTDVFVLLIYLSWPWPRLKLGKLYLPLALMIATVTPIIENFLTSGAGQTSALNLIMAFAGQWQLIIILLFPFILISWEYPYKWVVASDLFLGVLEGSLVAIASFMSNAQMEAVIGVIIFRTLLFLLVGYFINSLITEQRRQNHKFEQANRQLALQAKALEALATSRERNRLARELHDTLAHSLSALAVQLEAVSALWDSNPQRSHDLMEQSLTMTRNGLNEARRAIQSLRITPLEDLGLLLALRNLAISSAERNVATIDIRMPNELPALGPEVEHGIYRIVEEALRNIEQHARASHVDLWLEQKDHLLTLTIHDNGHGFISDWADQEDRFGLRGMRERAEEIGGRMSIASQPGVGSTILLQIELKEVDSLAGENL